ncbi:MAG: hypothetical protein IJU25_05060, partial [Lachnospiraceae bacterium]|nr:hypothetical protein [Lachnospiraceae bacterium]
LEDLVGETEEDRIANIPQGLWMSDIPAQEYSGAKIVPDVRVYCGKKKLVAGTDYTVAVTNNINAHDATVDSKSPLVTVTLKNSYSGTLKKTFEICKASLDDAKASDYVSAEDNKEQWVVPAVTFNGKALKNNTDFTVSYPDKETEGAYKEANENPGWEITLTGKGNFEGTKTVYLRITEGTPLAKCSIGNIGAQKYTGAAIEPKPVIKYKGKTLDEGDDEDYTLTYSDNVAPGTATVTIEAVDGSGYFGTVTKTFTITPLSIATATVTGLANKYDYLGTALTPFEDDGLAVKVGNDELTYGEDYDITYTKNDTAGTATAKLTGKGIYSGTKSFKFGINAYDIQKDEKHVIEVMFPDEADHNISGACPDVVVNILDPEDNTNVVRTLIEKQDYTLTYKNNKAIGDKGAGKKAPAITIKGKGPFKGTIEKQFTIVKASLEDVTMYVNDVVYKDVKDNYVTKVKLTDQNGKVLSPGKDYDKQFVYYYDDGTPAAKGDKADRKTTMMVQVFGRGNFKGSKTCKYRISDKNLSQATCTIKADTAANLIYTGNPVYLTEEDIIVKLSGSTVRPKNDKNEPLYVIVGYEKNVNPGTASVIIRGMGPYVGDKKVSFKILKKQAP